MHKLISIGLLMGGFSACSGGSDDKDDPTQSDTQDATDTESAAEEEWICEGEEGLDVGDCAPDFTLLNQHGEEFTLSEMRGNRVAIIGTAEW